MFSFVKWVGGGLGWTFGGPLGGVLGFIAGTVIDSLEIGTEKKDRKKTIGVFSTNLLMLIAAVMKAEAPVTRAEVNFVKQFLKKNFSEKGAGLALIQLKETLKQNIPVNDVCAQISNSLDYSSRLQLYSFLYNLAKIDGNITRTEQTVLDIIAAGLRVTFNNRQYADSTVVPDDSVVAAYEILGVNHASSVADVKKAYRRLAVKCHPDKATHLGEDMKRAANEEFQQLTNAYEIIKKEKNFT